MASCRASFSFGISVDICTFIILRTTGTNASLQNVSSNAKERHCYRDIRKIINFELTIFTKKLNQEEMKLIKQNLKLIFSVATFFVLVNALNFLNADDNISPYWKLVGAVLVVLFISTIKVDDTIEPSSTDGLIND
jgi:hypothetical protein